MRLKLITGGAAAPNRRTKMPVKKAKKAAKKPMKKCGCKCKKAAKKK